MLSGALCSTDSVEGAAVTAMRSLLFVRRLCREQVAEVGAARAQPVTWP